MVKITAGGFEQETFEITVSGTKLMRRVEKGAGQRTE